MSGLLWRTSCSLGCVKVLLLLSLLRPSTCAPSGPLVREAQVSQTLRADERESAVAVLSDEAASLWTAIAHR